MRKLFLFMMVSVDGYFEGENHDLSWHNVDAEFNEFAIRQTKQVGTLLFGKRTYDLMSSYWPSEQAVKNDPVVAGLMNKTPKVVFSKTLGRVEETGHWKNVRLLREINPEEIKKMKRETTKDLAVFGSNNLATQLLEMGLLDELRIMVNPVALGQGHALFTGLKNKANLKLINTKVFKSDSVLLYYTPVVK